MDVITLEQAKIAENAGICGAPTCRALAEDIVRGVSSDKECIFNSI